MAGTKTEAKGKKNRMVFGVKKETGRVTKNRSLEDQGCDAEKGQGFGSGEGRQGHAQDHEVAPRRRTRSPCIGSPPSWVHL